MGFNRLKLFFILFLFLILINGLHSQTEYDFPAGDFWSLSTGVGMTNFLVYGKPFQFIIEPRVWLSPILMAGSRTGINFSVETKTDTNTLSNILTLESQVYLRWNFLRLGENPARKIDLFIQGGLGLVAAYRGVDNPFDDVTETRGSIMADSALGITFPLTDRWFVEGSARGGYPHIWGFSVTGGYKFPLPTKTITETITDTITDTRIEYITFEIDRTLPSNEIVRRITIPVIEYILFGPDIGSYNIGIDHDAQQLNELALNQTIQMLKDNPNLRVRIEGHANPYTINRSEAEDLLALSTMRANVVADLLRARGISDEQIVLIAFGGTRTATNEWDIRNRNRRVEMMIIHFDNN